MCVCVCVCVCVYMCVCIFWIVRPMYTMSKGVTEASPPFKEFFILICCSFWYVIYRHVISSAQDAHSYAPHSQKFSTSHFYIGNVPGRWLLRISYCALKKNVAMRLTPQPLVAMHLTPSLFFFNLFRRSRRMLQCAWPPSLLRCDQISRARVLLPNVWLVCC